MILFGSGNRVRLLGEGLGVRRGGDQVGAFAGRWLGSSERERGSKIPRLI